MPPFDPTAPRDAGDAWVEGPNGTRYWGRFGAAGLLVVDRGRVLLQHRAEWSHHGGTWGIPGGARHLGESALDAALREAHEEAGVPPGAVTVTATSTLDLGWWSYATVIAHAHTPFEPVAMDDESDALAWIPADAVAGYPLHPAFAAAWPALRELATVRPAMVVDMANLVGSVPNGWWRDRLGATHTWVDGIAACMSEGLSAEVLEVGAAPQGCTLVWFPRTELVIEGAAARAWPDRSDQGLLPVEMPTDRTVVVRAPGEGDQAVVEAVDRLTRTGHVVTVVTSDRGLAARVATQASVRGTGWMRGLLPHV